MPTEKNRQRRKKLTTILSVLLVAAAVVLHYRLDPWGYYWKVSPEESAVRNAYVSAAQAYLGYNEHDGTHQAIIDLYNSHEPLAVGYEVQYSDSWCSAFVSAVSIQCGLTEIIPTECGCQRQIGLFQSIVRWEERDSAIPLPGDLIFYDWDMEEKGECTGWADHVGIVVGTKWPFIKVIEGNRNDMVAYHYLWVDDIQIRGFAKPDYAGFVQRNTP